MNSVVLHEYFLCLFGAVTWEVLSRIKSNQAYSLRNSLLSIKERIKWSIGIAGTLVALDDEAIGVLEYLFDILHEFELPGYFYYTIGLSSDAIMSMKKPKNKNANGD